LSYFKRLFLVVAVHVILVCVSAVLCCSAEDNRAASDHLSTDAAVVYQAASRISPPASADAVILDNEETVSFDADGKAVHTRYFLYKIITKRGATDWASVAASWDPWHEERPILRARVITPDSVAHMLDASTISDSPSRVTENDIFSDRRLIRAPLPAIGPDCVVEEEEISRDTAPFYGRGAVDRFYINGSVPIEHTRLVLEAPSTVPIRYEVRLLPELKPERTESNGRVRLTFEMGPVEAVEDVNSNLPGDTPAYASVTYSTGASWQNVAEDYAKIVDTQLADSDLKSVATRVLAGQLSREQKIAALVQYLAREVRYTGVEFGEAKLVPTSPQKTLTRKYGDCKDKAALLVVLLRKADIPAYIALLNTGSREDVSADLPGMGMFDHAIVYVPGTPDLWIDATDEYARLGELPDGDQGRLALIARAETTALTLTPTASSADNLVVEKREVFLAENGPSRIVETSQPHGSTEASYRRAYVDKENKNNKEELTNYMKSQYLAEKLDRLDRSDSNDLSKQFELVLESKKAKRGFTDLDIAVAAIRLGPVFSRLPAELRQREEDKGSQKAGDEKPKKARTADYQLPQAFVTEWRYTITPPAGFLMKSLPANVELSLGPAKLTEQFVAGKDNVVLATIRFDAVKRRMTAAEGQELRDKIVQVSDGAPILIYFEPAGQALLNNGKVREALKSYRDLIALHPKEAVHHLQLAQAFSSAGLGEAARSEARTAVALEPSSALAEKTLAEILEYDSVGRKFRPGSDYAGAEEAYRAAIKLDPEDKTNYANLAVLLEHNRWGLRYGPGAKLKDAVVEYRKLTPEELAGYQMQNNIPFALFYDGEFSEAKKAAEELNPQPLALIVACEAALNGPQAALSEARKRAGGEGQFKQIAETAGQMLINLRKYPEGADLEEAGASGSNASDTAAYASLYRKTVRHEDMQFADDPIGVALRFEVLMQDPDLGLDRLRSIASRNGEKALTTKENFDSHLKEARATISEKAREGSFADVGLDISLTRAQPRVQGNDTTGYKVTLWPSAKYKSERYIVKEGGHYKILATRKVSSGIGVEVLDRVNAGDLVGARTLLDWVREDWPLPGGDDPMAGAAFPHLWTKGKEGDAALIKAAAAFLLVQTKTVAPQAIPILDAASKSVPDDLRFYVMYALAQGYIAVDDYGRAFPILAQIAEKYPESESAFHMSLYTLWSSRRFDEADSLAKERLKRLPGDRYAGTALAATAEFRGDHGKAAELWKEVINSGQATPEDLNGSAWNSLFTGKSGSDDLETALKAAQLSNNAPSVLHTVGCVYAELGKTKEAREVLVQAMDALNLDEPDGNYWYAFGRIAEQYGERELAIADYRRGSVQDEAPYAAPVSTSHLAQMHLHALQDK